MRHFAVPIPVRLLSLLAALCVAFYLFGFSSSYTPSVHAQPADAKAEEKASFCSSSVLICPSYLTL